MISRQDVVEEARSWKGTPYIRKGSIKGTGCDCALLPYCVYRKFDLLPEFPIEYLADDWFANTSDERYLLVVQKYLKKLFSGRAYSDVPAKAGNLIVARVAKSKVFNHSGVITQWPLVVHSIDPMVEEVNASTHHMWARTEIEIYDPFESPC